MTSESPELTILKGIYNKLCDIEKIFQIKQIVSTTLADFSKSERPKTTTDKPAPEIIGNFTISAKGCNRCGGKISWDNYSKEAGGQNYPDHIDEAGNIIDCPEYN